MEQPKEYTIKTYKPGDFKDMNGNAWTEVLFEEYASEPIKWVVKDPTAYSIGQKVYGHLETKESKAGKPYLRFYRDQKPDFHGGGAASVGSVAAKKEWQPKDEHAIAKAVALKAAVDIVAPGNAGDISKDIVLGIADTFLAWLEADKPKLDATPDPMQPVHAQNPMNPAVTNEFGDGAEYLNNNEFPPDL